MSGSAFFLCLIGLPGAGKTTLARKLRDCLFEKSFIVLIFEFDEWLIREESGALKGKRQLALDRVRSTLLELRATHVNNDFLFILDDNFYYRSMRYEVYQIARQMGSCAFAEVLLDQPVEICIARNATRQSQSVPVETIRRMSQLLEKPKPSKHIWERFSLVVTSALDEDEIKKRVTDLVEAARLHPVAPLVPPKTVLPELVSQIHVADLALRRNVAGVLSACSSLDKNSESKRLTTIKKTLLFAIKCGEILLPELGNSEDRLTEYCDFLMPYFYPESL